MFSKILKNLAPIFPVAREARAMLSTYAAPRATQERGVLSELAAISGLRRTNSQLKPVFHPGPMFPPEPMSRRRPMFAPGTTTSAGPRIPAHEPRAEARPMPSSGSLRFPTDLRPPASPEEEREQLALALEQSRVEAFLKDLPFASANFDAAAAGESVTDWERLPAEIKGVYTSKAEYEQEVTATLMATPNIERALTGARMHAVPNDGMTVGGSNTCFGKAFFQHVLKDYSSPHSAHVDQHVDQYWDILSAAPHLNFAPNEKMSSGSEAARTLVDLVNADPDVQPKLKVVVISEVNGVVHRDTLGSDAPDARTVVILDKGGHFEAVTGPLELD